MMSKEAMKLALEALEKISRGGDPRWADDVLPTLREALAEQPAQQEPVAAQSVMTVRIWRDKNSDQNAEFKNWHKLPDGEHILYTSPPAQRKPLNWEPIQEFWRNNSSIDWDELEAAIEAAHGIKENT